MITATKIFRFCCAHKLFLTYQSKCAQFHGHNYQLHVTVIGKVSQCGLVMDFNDIKKKVDELVIQKLDHKNLNEVMKDNPTAENMVKWIFEQLNERIPLHSLKLYETDDSYVELNLCDK